MPLIEEYTTAESLSGFAHAASEGDNYCNFTREPSFALSESNLIAMEDLFKQFIDENGYPVTWTSTSYQPTNMALSIGGLHLGDRVKTAETLSNSSHKTTPWHFEPEEEYVVRENIFPGYICLEVVKTYPLHPDDMGRVVHCSTQNFQHFFTSISSPSIYMDIVQIIRNTFTWTFGSKEEKLLRKTGLKDSNGQFTDKARQAFLEQMMQNDVEDDDEGILLTMADIINEEMDEENLCGKKKCC